MTKTEFNYYCYNLFIIFLEIICQFLFLSLAAYPKLEYKLTWKCFFRKQYSSVLLWEGGRGCFVDVSTIGLLEILSPGLWVHGKTEALGPAKVLHWPTAVAEVSSRHSRKWKLVLTPRGSWWPNMLFTVLTAVGLEFVWEASLEKSFWCNITCHSF